MIDLTLAFEDAIARLVDIDIDIDDVEFKDRVGDRLVNADSLVTAFHSYLVKTQSYLVPGTFEFGVTLAMFQTFYRLVFLTVPPKK